MVLTLAGAPARPLLDALFNAIGVAAERVDLRLHRGAHPRVGVADVVPLIPLGGGSVDDCVAPCHTLGERVWSELRIPVYLYGGAAERPESLALSSIRAGRSRPDLGGPEPHPTAGAVCIGARGPLVAYNVLLPGASRAEALEVVRGMRETGGGLTGVQALAFEVGDGVQQLSMNLTRPDLTSLPRVLERVRSLHPGAGPDELIGLCPAAAAGPVAAGPGILELRLAAAATTIGSAAVRARGGDEQERLAAKLDREAESLTTLGIEAEAFLAGAERAYAILRVLRAAGDLRPDLEAMLDAAARGLRAAAGSEAAAAFPDRARLLDAWLG